jgi:glutathione-regulated potassium-efflux system ancillary protein KefF
MTRVLVLAAHPDLRLSRVNKALLDAARALAAQQPGRVAVRDLYALYPDYLVDVPAEQAAAAAADLIVWQHPVHWYGMPPLLKLWLDEVLQLGWAYGHGAHALRGKDLWLVASTGGQEQAYRPDGYNRYFFDAFLPPYDQTATLCGMRLLPPMLMHGAHTVADADIAEHAATYAQRLASYPDWPELAELAPCATCVMPDIDRPALVEGA